MRQVRTLVRFDWKHRLRAQHLRCHAAQDPEAQDIGQAAGGDRAPEGGLQSSLSSAAASTRVRREMISDRDRSFLPHHHSFRPQRLFPPFGHRPEANVITNSQASGKLTRLAGVCIRGSRICGVRAPTDRAAVCVTTTARPLPVPRTRTVRSAYPFRCMLLPQLSSRTVR